MKVLENPYFQKSFGIKKIIRKKVVLKDPVAEKIRKFSPINLNDKNKTSFFVCRVETSHLFDSNRDTQQKGSEANVAQGMLCLCLVFNHHIPTLLLQMTPQ